MRNDTKSRLTKFRLSFAAGLLSLITATTPVAATPSGNPNAASGGPVLEDSYAAASVASGQTWHIYLKGHDPTEDMQYIWIEITQLGGRNSTEIVYLRCVYRENLYGYVAVYLPHVKTGWQTVRAEIKVKDAGGNYSNMKVHEVQVGTYSNAGIPEQWQSAARNHIGNIFFDFDSDRSHGRR